MQNLENLQLGRFKVTKLLGMGGFSVVYKVFDTTSQTDKVIKLLAKAWMKDEKIEKSFLNEGELARSFTHPNIIKVFEVGRVYGQPYHLMEYWSEINLRHWLEATDLEKNRQNVCRLINQMAEALDYIHTKGFIHRDVKPENFLVAPNLDVKLLDFGIAQSLLGIRLKDIGSSGTPQYMSPEQKMGRSFDVQTDTYSFGLVAKELLASAQISLHADALTLMNAVLDDNPRKRPENLVQFAQVFCTALAKD